MPCRRAFTVAVLLVASGSTDRPAHAQPLPFGPQGLGGGGVGGGYGGGFGGGVGGGFGGGFGGGLSPAVSPYLNLTRQGSNPAVNYYGIVRPQLQLSNSLQSLRGQVNQVNPFTNTVEGDPLLVTGNAAGFQNYRYYFQNQYTMGGYGTGQRGMGGYGRTGGGLSGNSGFGGMAGSGSGLGVAPAAPRR